MVRFLPQVLGFFLRAKFIFDYRETANGIRQVERTLIFAARFSAFRFSRFVTPHSRKLRVCFSDHWRGGGTE